MKVQRMFKVLVVGLVSLVVAGSGFAYQEVNVPNDYESISDAVAAIQQPGVVVLDEGEYEIGEELSLPHGICLRGTSREGTILTLNGNLRLIERNIVANLTIKIEGSARLYVDALYIAGILGCNLVGGVVESTKDCLKFTVRDCHFNNCTIANNAESTVKTTLINCVFENCGEQTWRGVSADECAFYQCARLTVENNALGDGCKFSNCIFIESKNSAIYQVSGATTAIDRCFFSGLNIVVRQGSMAVSSCIFYHYATAIDLYSRSSSGSPSRSKITLSNCLFQFITNPFWYSSYRSPYEVSEERVIESNNIRDGSEIQVITERLTYTFTPDSSLVGAGPDGTDIGPVQLADLQSPSITSLEVDPLIVGTEGKINVEATGEAASY